MPGRRWPDPRRRLEVRGQRCVLCFLGGASGQGSGPEELRSHHHLRRHMESVWGQTLRAEQGPGRSGVDVRGQRARAGPWASRVRQGPHLAAAHFSELPLPSRSFHSDTTGCSPGTTGAGLWFLCPQGPAPLPWLSFRQLSLCWRWCEEGGCSYGAPTHGWIYRKLSLRSRTFLGLKTACPLLDKDVSGQSRASSVTSPCPRSPGRCASGKRLSEGSSSQRGDQPTLAHVSLSLPSREHLGPWRMGIVVPAGWSPLLFSAAGPQAGECRHDPSWLSLLEVWLRRGLGPLLGAPCPLGLCI